jgi:hypothetical protein
MGSVNQWGQRSRINKANTDIRMGSLVAWICPCGKEMPSDHPEKQTLNRRHCHKLSHDKSNSHIQTSVTLAILETGEHTPNKQAFCESVSADLIYFFWKTRSMSGHFTAT